jgi:hypothetical protein
MYGCHLFWSLARLHLYTRIHLAEMSLKLADLLGRLTRQAGTSRAPSMTPCRFLTTCRPSASSRIPPVPRPMGISPASASPFVNLCPRIRAQSSSQASFLRSFSTTRPNMMRPNYFPRSSGSGGAPRAGPIRRALIRLDSMPHLYVVRQTSHCQFWLTPSTKYDAK